MSVDPKQEENKKIEEELRSALARVASQDVLIAIRKTITQFKEEYENDLTILQNDAKMLIDTIEKGRAVMVELRQAVSQVKEVADFVALNKMLLESLKK